MAVRTPRVLDFDIETRAAGFGDPDWVPQEITAIAWSWIGDEKVAVQLRCYGLRRMFERFVRAYDRADIVTGHNIRKFDLPIVNAELVRNSLPPLTSKLTQDTLRDIVRTKGMKRDQDNLAKQFRLPLVKQSMSWMDWQDAYAEKGWPEVRSRCVSDVAQHKALREAMLAGGWMKPARRWTP